MNSAGDAVGPTARDLRNRARGLMAEMNGLFRNEEIARRFDDVARLLSEQDANPYRVQAYRHTESAIERSRLTSRWSFVQNLC